jgi:hypothetical protein
MPLSGQEFVRPEIGDSVSKRLEITAEMAEAIDIAEDTLRQIIQGNTSTDGAEARAALVGLMGVCPKRLPELVHARPNGGDAA